jgi:hypothetical protein
MVIVISMVLIVQLVVLGYHQRRGIGTSGRCRRSGSGVPAVKIRGMASAVSGIRRSTSRLLGSGQALAACRNGRVAACSRFRRYSARRSRAAESRGDRRQHLTALCLLLAHLGQMVSSSSQPTPAPVFRPAVLDIVGHPFVPYVQYLLPGSITMSIS